MATAAAASPSTKVIRIQEDEKVLLFQLREIYGNDYKKYGEYIRRESTVPLSIKKIYKLLDERKAYRRISDYFHRERASKKVKDPRSNGVDALYNRSTTRGITQVPNPISSLNMDHEMDDDDDDDDDVDNDDALNQNGDDNQASVDHGQQQPPSPTMTNGSDEPNGTNHMMMNEDDAAQQLRHPSILTQTHHRKRMTLLNQHHRRPVASSTMNDKSDLLSVRTHLQKALHELDRVLVGKDDHDGESMRSPSTKSSLSTNGHRHSKLDDIVRSLSSVVNQQQENARRILDESSVLLTDDEQQVNDEQQQPIRLPPTTQESIKVVLDRLNALVDRGNAIYDRVESILSEL